MEKEEVQNDDEVEAPMLKMNVEELKCEEPSSHAERSVHTGCPTWCIPYPIYQITQNMNLKGLLIGIFFLVLAVIVVIVIAVVSSSSGKGK